MLLPLKNLDFLALARQTAKNVPAYREFLKLKGAKVPNFDKDFLALPETDKNSYFRAFQLKKLFPKEVLPPFAYASSGSSGKPTFWFRGSEQERIGVESHEVIFRDIWNIGKSDETLVIICFSMGLWVAGSYTLASCRGLSQKGYKITAVTPSIDKADTVYVFKKLCPQFKNVVIAGYPPFVADVLLEVKKRKIDIPKNLYILTAGDSFTEKWRDDIGALANIKKPHHIVSVYGSADTGILAFETPLTIALRRKAQKDRALACSLFGEVKEIPPILQYDPRMLFIEESKGGELLITAPTASPLIRYNIHDRGKIIDLNKLQEKWKLPDVGRKFNGWNKMPVISTFGRTDVAVTLYALNIYPEHIISCIKRAPFKNLLSGSFLVYNKTTHGSKRQTLHIRLEMLPRAEKQAARFGNASDVFAEYLSQVNIEYKKLKSAIGRKALPKIHFMQNGDSLLWKNKGPGLVFTKGKKSRITNND
ncbi:MAG: hypothetical protein Q8P86_03025 [bacterium]|nr:hypothetical protein [bacterium]